MSFLESPRLENFQKQLADRDFTAEKQDQFRQECKALDGLALALTFGLLSAKAQDTTLSTYDRAIADKQLKIAKSLIPAQN